MSKKPRKKPSDVASRIEAHPGTQMLRAFQSCEIAKEGFEISALQVRRLILSLEDPRSPLTAAWPGDRDKLEASFQEVFRRFLQFLGAVHALVERTEKVIHEDFVPEAHRVEHRAAAESAFTGPAARFLHDFRTYLRHRAAPAMVLIRHDVPRPKLIELLIDAPEMLHWGKWTSPARSYLHQFQFKLPVLRMIDGHEQRARTFYHRFVQQFRRHHKADMDSAAALMEELHGPSSCPLQ